MNQISQSQDLTLTETPTSLAIQRRYANHYTDSQDLLLATGNMLMNGNCRASQHRRGRRRVSLTTTAVPRSSGLHGGKGGSDYPAIRTTEGQLFGIGNV